MMAGLPVMRKCIVGGNIVAAKTEKADGMDLCWVELILEAKKLGITKETVLHFLRQNGVNGQTVNG